MIADTKRTILVLAVMLVAVITPFLLGQQGLTTLSDIAHNLVHISQTTLDQRRAETYADLGFAYITRIWQYYPFQDHFPITRYKDANRNVQILLPQIINHTDDFVLLALDVPPQALVTNPIADLSSVSATDQSQSSWTLRTGDDYSTLNGFEFVPATCGAAQVQLTLQFFSTVDDNQPVVVTSDSVTCTPAIPIEITLPAPVTNLSFGRGGVPFLLTVTATASETWDRITAMGIKVDATGFTMVNHEDQNYTFIRDDVLHTAEQEHDVWWTFINHIRNV